MNFYQEYKSPFGYQTGTNGIDSYGVDHRGFDTRDELEYQTARNTKERRLATDLQRQGIGENDHPQYGTDFWGNSENNYGFGIRNIGQNVQNHPAMNMTPVQNQQSAPSQQAETNVMLQQNSMRLVEGGVQNFRYGEGFSHEFINQMLNDTRFQKAMMRTRKNEGGYVNHPNDRGGATNYGISSRVYPSEDIKNMTKERADAIYYRDYWLKPKINQLPDDFANIVFDNGVVQGQSTAIMNLQKALGVKADGIIGSDTLAASKNTNYKNIRTDFINNVNKVEDQYQRRNPSQIIFEKGHRKRYGEY